MRILSLSLFLALMACSSSTPSFHGIQMTIPYRIILGQKISTKQARQIKEIIDITFKEADSTLNHWNPSSEISLINQSGKGTFTCSDDLLFLFKLANDLVVLSKERFDPSIGLAITSWKDSLSKGEYIDSATIDKWKHVIGWDKLLLENNTITKYEDSLYFDFDSISKGFVVDKLIKKLKDIGIKDASVEWGGEICVIGHTRLGNTWKIGISHPVDPTQTIDVLQMTNRACATSGNYIQRWRVADKDYTHFIHAKNLTPIEVSSPSISSVTVLGPSCSLADGLATIACLFDNTQDLETWTQAIKAKNPEIDFIIIYEM
ncbi:MAG: FAD:protein FMN transferase [Chlamydiales bacterium]|nr:FAD:protein FMN transferase [Chlamydiales bacterium]